MLKLYGETCTGSSTCDSKKDLSCINSVCLCDSTHFYDNTLNKCGNYHDNRSSFFLFNIQCNLLIKY